MSQLYTISRGVCKRYGLRGWDVSDILKGLYDEEIIDAADDLTKGMDLLDQTPDGVNDDMRLSDPAFDEDEGDAESWGEDIEPLDDDIYIEDNGDAVYMGFTRVHSLPNGEPDIEGIAEWKQTAEMGSEWAVWKTLEDGTMEQVVVPVLDELERLEGDEDEDLEPEPLDETTTEPEEPMVPETTPAMAVETPEPIAELPITNQPKANIVV